MALPDWELTEDPVLKDWEPPRMETLEVASTEGGPRPDTKENGAKFVAS